MDFIMNGQATGSVASRLLASGFNTNVLRPYIGKDGRSYVTVINSKGKPEAMVTNAPASLRYEDWRLLDSVVLKAARARLRLVADLRGGGLSFNIPNGMGKTVFSTENQTDPGTATVSMDGIRKTVTARPEFNLVNLPLPITHSDFDFSARQVQVSRNGGSPLDLSMAEAAARRVSEVVEQLAIGSYGAYSFGGGSLYGITTFPNRLTYSLNLPTATGWTATKTLNDVLAMKSKSQAIFNFGPWILYYGTAWDQYLDNDYSATKGDVTLRERIQKIDGIQDIRALDYLSGFQMVLVQQSTNTIREIVGMDITTVQWETEGGMQLNFKVMCIMVPQIRADANSNCGIVHGS